MNCGAENTVGRADELALRHEIAGFHGKPRRCADMLQERNVTGMGYRKIYEFQVFGYAFMSGRMNATAKARKHPYTSLVEYISSFIGSSFLRFLIYGNSSPASV